MTKVNVEFSTANIQKGGSNAQAPVADGLLQEALTVSGSSAVTTISAPASDSLLVLTNISAGAVWATFGPTPTAVVNSGYLIPSGAIRSFTAVRENTKVAVIQDS